MLTQEGWTEIHATLFRICHQLGQPTTFSVHFQIVLYFVLVFRITLKFFVIMQQGMKRFGGILTSAWHWHLCSHKITFYSIFLFYLYNLFYHSNFLTKKCSSSQMQLFYIVSHLHCIRHIWKKLKLSFFVFPSLLKKNLQHQISVFVTGWDALPQC